MTLTRTFSFQEQSSAGILYLISTPIGNLGDLSSRAIEILSGVYMIAAEDTRHTWKLLNHFSIEGPQVISYHEHNKHLAKETILQALKDGHDIACVTDAGTPGISDPGQELVAEARLLGLPVSTVPGPSAAIAALTISGLSTVQFSFVGFLPRQKKNRRAELEKWKSRAETLIFYEAPHRVKETLREMVQVLGEDRKIAAARELTKRYEEVITGTVMELLTALEDGEIRGEWVLIVEGAAQNTSEKQIQPEGHLPVEERVKKLMETGLVKKDAVKQVAKERGLSRNEVYQTVLDLDGAGK
ncbi:MAG: rsmI [Bacilli bacterium]|nr:rsmI [Bacilli bacterium]